MAGVDSYTKLLLHMDGADDGIIFTDSSLSPHTITRFDAVTKTGIKQLGTASAYFDGSSDYLTAPNSSDWDFGTGDFTVDFWFRRFNTTTLNRIISQYTNNDNRWYVFVGNSSESYSVGIGGPGNANVLWSNQCENVGQWYHIAIVRDGNDFELFVDGVSKGTEVDSGSIGYSGQLLHVGVDKYNSIISASTHGYIDELRISKGIARWTTGFTPPTAAYSPYQISGNLSDDSRIILVVESTGAVEYNEIVSAGSYSIDVGDDSERWIFAGKTSTGETLGYGKVIPIE